MSRFRVGQTGLIAPVAAAEPVVGRLREAYDEAAAYGVPAHVTVLFPFLPLEAIDEEVRAALSDIVAAEPAFEVVLAEVGRFPGVTWLRPEPDRPFRALTAGVEARWPDHPAYAGAFAETVPHLTVAEGDEDVLDRADREVLAGLPVTGWVDRVDLIAFDGRTWTRRASFGLSRRTPLAPAPRGGRRRWRGSAA